jgi:hypothetical protein
MGTLSTAVAFMAQLFARLSQILTINQTVTTNLINWEQYAKTLIAKVEPRKREK